MAFRSFILILWTAPNTMFGLLLAVPALAGGGTLRRYDGALEAHGPWIDWMLNHLIPLPGGALAITLGHLVMARSPKALALTRTHERVHVRQYERWGPFFIPAYFLESAWQWSRGRDYYRANRFEVEAYAAEGR